MDSFFKKNLTTIINCYLSYFNFTAISIIVIMIDQFTKISVTIIIIIINSILPNSANFRYLNFTIIIVVIIFKLLLLFQPHLSQFFFIYIISIFYSKYKVV